MGGRARSSCSSSRCSTASTSRELGQAEFVHVVTECAKLAFADRDALYGDAEEVPLETLLSKAYNDERRALVGDDASGELPARARPAARASSPRR